MGPGKTSNFWKHVLLGIAFSLLTLLAASAISQLPYSRTRDAISDAIAYPGALISSPFYPEGVHTGQGSPSWAYAAIAGNAMFYALIWFLVIRVVANIRKRGGKPSSPSR